VVIIKFPPLLKVPVISEPPSILYVTVPFIGPINLIVVVEPEQIVLAPLIDIVAVGNGLTTKAALLDVKGVHGDVPLTTTL